MGAAARIRRWALRSAWLAAALLAACGGAGAAASATSGDAASGDGAGPAADAATAADGSLAVDAAAGDAAVSDAASDTAADAAPLISRKPPACPKSATPVACYHKCQPAGDAAAPAAPAVPQCPAVYSGLTWASADGQPPQPASLEFTIGSADADTGAFVPYQVGGAATPWAPLVEGVQGGIHLWAAVRVALPAGTPTKVVLEVAGHALIGDGKGGCKAVATELVGTSKVIAVAQPGQAGWWTNASKLVPGVPVAFEKNDAAAYCGQWVRLVVEVREPKSGAWGRKSVDLRLWDLDNL